MATLHINAHEPFEGYLDLLESYGNEWLSESYNDCLIPMEEFNADFEDKSPISIANSLRFGGHYGFDGEGNYGRISGGFNPDSGYFAYDGYGNPFSVRTDERLDYLYTFVEEDYFLEWCREEGYLDEDEDFDDED